MRGPLAKEESSAMATNTPLMAAQINAQADPLNATLAISKEITTYLTGMKSALQRDDVAELKHFASKLCGITAPAITSAKAS
jgi:hypothetical protein